MTTTDIELLRLYIADPAGQDQVFATTLLADTLDRNSGDVNAAAAEMWGIKAATVADWYLSQTDGALLSRDQVFQHCLKMQTQYKSLSSSSMVNVRMTTQSDDLVESSEF
jgi:hypothetical protein